MRKLALTVAVAALGFAVFFARLHRVTRVSGRPAAVKPAPVVPAAPAAPQILLTDLNGDSFNTSSYQGKVVLVNFWAAWCGPCTAEIPQFVAMQEKYQVQGLQILGVSMDDADQVLRKFYREHKMNYPVVAGDQKIADAYGGVLGLPTTFLIGRDGRIEDKVVGSTDFHKLEQEVAALLGFPER
jgi:cytochrome c biogenesis protein CcmG/thiol:disulfide interchange protein DsbE